MNEVNIYYCERVSPGFILVYVSGGLTLILLIIYFIKVNTKLSTFHDRALKKMRQNDIGAINKGMERRIQNNSITDPAEKAKLYEECETEKIIVNEKYDAFEEALEKEITE